MRDFPFRATRAIFRTYCRYIEFSLLQAVYEAFTGIRCRIYEEEHLSFDYSARSQTQERQRKTRSDTIPAARVTEREKKDGTKQMEKGKKNREHGRERYDLPFASRPVRTLRSNDFGDESWRRSSRWRSIRFTGSSVSVRSEVGRYGRVFRNWNDRDGRDWRRRAESGRASISSVEIRSVSLACATCCSERAVAANYEAALSALNFPGFIVRSEVIPMLIPLCPRGWTEPASGGRGISTPVACHDYVKRNEIDDGILPSKLGT